MADLDGEGGRDDLIACVVRDDILFRVEAQLRERCVEEALAPEIRYGRRGWIFDSAGSRLVGIVNAECVHVDFDEFVGVNRAASHGDLEAEDCHCSFVRNQEA